MKEKSNKNNKAGVVRTCFKTGAVIGIVFCLVWAFAGPYPNVVDDGKSWHLVWEGSFAEAAEASPAAGAGGILEIFFINYSAGNDYSGVNLSSTLETWCTAANLGYANADDFNTELAHSTNFGIIVRVRANKTQAWRTDKFFDTDVNVTMTSSDLSISADTSMTRSATRNNTADNYIWLNFYLTGPYSLSKDQSADITSIKLECYY